MTRLTVLLLVPMCGFGALELFHAPANVAERPVSGSFQMDHAYVGDTSSARFRIRNTGTSPEVLRLLRVSGAGFSMTGEPVRPHTIAAGSNVEFTIHFTPPDYGGYSANLEVNSMSVMLRAGASPGLSLFRDGELVSRGSTIDFGRIERGSTTSVHIDVRNTTNEPVGFRWLTISGGAFAWDGGGPPYVYLEPGQTSGFSIRFQPQEAKVFAGEMVIDRERTIKLTGTAFEPPLPRPSLVLATPVVRSGEQGRVSVRLESPSRGKGKGKLTIALRPAGSVKDNDSGAQFATGGRTVEFDIIEKEQRVWFGTHGPNEIVFQAGTTAGTLTLTVESGGYTDETSLVVEPEPVRIDNTSVSRDGAMLAVQVAGFDNTRTVSDLHFTFYDAKGNALGGPIKAEAAGAFARWWESSDLGGVFSLKAIFPVAGDASKVSSVEVQATNAAGTAKTGRLSF
jgi:hypothetical protein